MPQSKQILVVGGGVIGLCTAYYAMLDGHDVTLVERGRPDHDSCSLGNAGMIVPSHFVPLAAPGMIGYGLRMLAKPESPFAIRPRLDRDLIRWAWLFSQACRAARVTKAAPLLRDLSLASRRAYEELSAQFGDMFGLTKRGLLMLCKSEQQLNEEAHLAEMSCRLGLPAHVLTAKEAAALDPGIRMDIAGAVHFQQDCHLTPQAFIGQLTQTLAEGGVKFLWHTDLTGWKVGRGRVLAARTTRGDFTADEYVLAGGAWSPQTLRELNLKLPMQAGKGYSVTLSKPRQMPHLCSILTEARVAVTPMGDTLRFAGTMEITGLDPSISRPRVNGIVNAIPRYFPDFDLNDFRDLPVWSGLRPCSPDGLPYIGRFDRYANLSVASGHSMMGISLGPITGQLMADVLSNRSPFLSIDALSPDRYR